MSSKFQNTQLMNASQIGIAFVEGPKGPTGPSSTYTGPIGPRFVGLPIVDTENRVYTTQTMYNTILSTPQDIHTGANFQVNTISLGQTNQFLFEEAGPQTGVLVNAKQYDAKNDFVAKSEILNSSFANQFQNTFLTELGTTFTGNCGSIKISDTKLILNTIFPKNSFGSLNQNFVHNGILIDQGSFYTPNPSPFIGGIPNIAGLQVSALGVNIPVQNAYGAMIRHPLTGTNCNVGIFTDSLSMGSNNITVRPPLNGMLIQGDIVPHKDLILINNDNNDTYTNRLIAQDNYTEQLIARNISGPTGSNLLPVHCNGLNILTGGIIYKIPTNPFISYIEGEFTAKVHVTYVTTVLNYQYQIEGEYHNELNDGPQKGIDGTATKSDTYSYVYIINPGTTKVPTVWYYTVEDAIDNSVAIVISGSSHTRNWLSPAQYDYNTMITYNCPNPTPVDVRCRYTRFGARVTLNLDPFTFTGQQDAYNYHATQVNGTLDYYYMIKNIPSYLLHRTGVDTKTFMCMKYKYAGKHYHYYHTNDLFSADNPTTIGADSQGLGYVVINSDRLEICDSNRTYFKARSTSGWRSSTISYTIDPTIPYT